MDWLAGGDRRDLAAERIYAAATESVAASGMDQLSIDDVATRAGCSRATVYRYVGGKRDLRDAVLARSIARIGAEVAVAVDGLDGAERIAQAIVISLDSIRRDPVAGGILTGSPAAHAITRSLIDSPRLAGAAAELAGLSPHDQVAPEWVVRVVLALLFWPMPRDREEVVIRDFVAQGVAVHD